MFQEIDGQALLLLTLPTLQEHLDLKLGPAIKLCHHIETIKIAFFEQFAKWRWRHSQHVAGVCDTDRILQYFIKNWCKRLASCSSQIGRVILVGITGTAKLVPYHFIKSLPLDWRSGTSRWNLLVPDLQVSGSGLTCIRGYQDNSHSNGC